MAHCDGRVTIQDCLVCPFPDCVMEKSNYHRALKCDDCDQCTEILRENGENTQRICMVSRRMIGHQCKARPQWCPKKQKVER